MNREGKDCPNCNKDIGFWAIMRTPLPTYFYCKHCGTKLTYQSKGWPLILGFSFLYLSLIALVAMYVSLSPISWVILIICTILFWQPFEFALAYNLRKSHKLVIKNS